MPLGVKVGLGSRPRRLYVRCGPRYPRKKGTPAALNFWPMTCGQTAGWIKMPLGTQVNVGPGDVVLDGIAAPPPLKDIATAPVFDSCLLWPNGWMDEDATWYRSRPRPRPHCIRRDPSCPPKGHSTPPLFFGPCLLLWPRSPISATAELLLFPYLVLYLVVCIFCIVFRIFLFTAFTMYFSPEGCLPSVVLNSPICSAHVWYDQTVAHLSY